MYHYIHEHHTHEGTWLTWPHPYTYGKAYAAAIEPIWLAIVQALADSENVHIIAYNNTLQQQITAQLTNLHINMSRIDFVIAKSDDVWIRDTGPIFTSANGKLTIVDFSFDGWGRKAPYQKDRQLAQIIANAKQYPLVKVDNFILEGGSFELSSDMTLMATKSAIISKNRNVTLHQQQAENYLRHYLGAKKFIWLEGVLDEDITDAHIDGFARFYDDNTILTVSREDFLFLYDKIQLSDYDVLQSATNVSGETYRLIDVPLTKKNVKNLNYKGSYLNYYVGNRVLLLPIYDDPHDDVAITLFKQLYPTKQIVPINVTPLYKNGGMLHCITQQQPYIK